MVQQVVELHCELTFKNTIITCMHVCNMGKYGGLLADALALGNHVRTGLLPPVPVVQHHILALGEDEIQLLVSEVAVVVLDPGGELVPVRVQAQDHAFCW